MSGAKKTKTKKLRPSPEQIEEIRKQRQLKKEQEEQKLLAQGLDPDDVNKPPELRYIKRQLLSLKGKTEVKEDAASSDTPPLNIKIMSYNMLAQALIRRKLFPTSGNALKWSTRCQVLLSEIQHYNADIMCLQEVDYIQFNSYWKNKFCLLGYESKYYRSGAKNHGLVIVFKSNLFVCSHLCHINYDKENTGPILKPSCVTNNVGLLACLDFTPEAIAKYKPKNRGVIVGTTHLFWHPFGTYERTRQTYIILRKVKEFWSTLKTIEGESSNWWTFFAGDFNSQPFDSPYLSITNKPVTYKERAPKVLGCSLSYQYSKLRGTVDDGEDGDVGDDDVSEEGKEEESLAQENEEDKEDEEEGGNVEKYGSNQPKDPVPDHFELTEEQLTIVNEMEKLHNSLDMKAISVYSAGYRLVDPSNAGLDNERGEPYFSNWANTWRGLLDYIFLITPWTPTTERSSKIDGLSTLLEYGVELESLLKLPHPDDMGPEPSGQPRIGQYPSDHLAIMANLRLQ